MSTKTPKNRDSFIFYRSFYETIQDLPDEEKLAAYDAITNYALNFRLPTLKVASNIFFKMAKPILDGNTRKWRNGFKGRQYGANGGRPKKDKTPVGIEKKPQENPNTSLDVDEDNIIKTKEGNSYVLPLTLREKYKKTYSKIDLDQELRNISTWCECNPSKRKTKRGMPRFINNWLSRSNEKAVSNTKKIIGSNFD